ncbi:MAG: carboxypeptidase regulatory-like domain-containing protein, partial [Planctomycetota bacterium]
PLKGVDVLVGVSNSQNAMRMPDYTKAVRTDSEGVFRVEGVGKGHISTLSVRAPGFGDLRLNAFQATDAALWRTVKALRLTGQGEQELPPLALLPGKELCGTIRDELTNRPLPDAVVELWDFIMGNRATRTENDGTYCFTGVGDRVVMIVSKRGYATFRDPPVPGLALSRGSTATRDISLELGGSLEGTVRASGGEPVPRARVRLVPADRGYGAWRTALGLRDIWTHTDPGGNYRLTGVPAVRLFAMADAPGFDSGSSEEQEMQSGGLQRGVDISLEKGARVEGIVVTEGGTAVAGARVIVAREPEEKGETAAWRALSEGAFTFTDRQGRFSLANVPVGSLLIRAEAQGLAEVTHRQAEVKGGQGIASLRFELPTAVVISGRVVDTAGQPVDGCWLRLKHTVSPKGTLRREPIHLRAGSDGTFRIDNLPAGTYALDAHATSPLPGRRELRDLRTDVEGGAQDLVLTLESK